MIEYEVDRFGIFFAFRLRGSVFPKSFGFAVACAGLTVLLHWWLSQSGKKEDFDIGSKGTTVVSMFTFVLGFLLVFRTQQAYNRWWEGGSLLQELRGEWFNAYSCLLAFGNQSPEKRNEVMKFNHQLARLLSMLHGAGLAQVCSMNVKRFDVVDLEDFDNEGLAFLDSTFDSCEVALQWIQRLIGDANSKETIKVAPPILSRVYNQLGNGIVKLSKARKIAKFPIPFPFAQMVTIMLLTHWLMAAIVCATSIESRVWSAVLSFAVIISFWSMNYIALELEDPFGDDANDLPLIDMQKELNYSIKALLQKPAMKPPDYDFNLAYHEEMYFKNVDFNRRVHQSVESIHETRDKDIFSQHEKRKGMGAFAPPAEKAPSTAAAPAAKAPAPQVVGAKAAPAPPPVNTTKPADPSASKGEQGSSAKDSLSVAEHLKVCKGMDEKLSKAVAQLQANGTQLEKHVENQAVLYHLHCEGFGLLSNMLQRVKLDPPVTSPSGSPTQASWVNGTASPSIAAPSELQPILAVRACDTVLSPEHVALDVSDDVAASLRGNRAG